MQRAHLTAAVAALAIASTLVAPGLDESVGDGEPPAPVSAPESPEPSAAAAAPRPAPPRARIVAVERPPTCHDESTLVVAHELSGSILEGRELPGPRLADTLERVRSVMPDHVGFGVVGFAQQLWSARGASTDPAATPWVPIGSGDAIAVPEDVSSTSGTCANVALGLEAAITQLRDAPGARALWLVVDGLHDCDAEGRFAYTALAPIADRAAALDIDLSVLVVDAWSERRGPTPLHDLVRGTGTVVHVPAWELGEGYAELGSTLQTRPCAR